MEMAGLNCSADRKLNSLSISVPPIRTEANTSRNASAAPIPRRNSQIIAASRSGIVAVSNARGTSTDGMIETESHPTSRAFIVCGAGISSE